MPFLFLLVYFLLCRRFLAKTNKLEDKCYVIRCVRYMNEKGNIERMLSCTGMTDEMIEHQLTSIGRYILDNRVRLEPMKD
jgi:hypothetical protein